MTSKIERHGVPNHQPHNCLLNCLFGRRWKANQSSASLVFVRGIRRWPVNSPHKGPVTRKMFTFADVIMIKLHVVSPNFRIIITRHSEVIMCSYCVFVCVCLYHDVCRDDFTMKDWCHTNNILQVHYWGCIVVQVMFHALMTSSMTSPGHKVGQILKLIYLRQYLSYSVDQKFKISVMLMAILLVYSTSGITSAEKVCSELKMAAILKIFKY